MTFNSVEFGWFFFIVISLCAVWPQARTLILLAASFIFYSWTSWTFGLILTAISICGYLAPPLFAQLKAHRARIAILLACIIAILSPLFILKYWNLFGSTIWESAAGLGIFFDPTRYPNGPAVPIPPDRACPSNYDIQDGMCRPFGRLISFDGFAIVVLILAASGCLAPVLHGNSRSRRARTAILFAYLFLFLILVVLIWGASVAAAIEALVLIRINQPLPPGLSFHSFQLISYVIDVYRKAAPVEPRPGIFFLFSSFFPQFIAGPIERPGHLIPQLRTAGLLSRKNSRVAFRLFLHGLFLKVAVADIVGIKVDEVYSGSTSYSGAALFAGTALFYIQIYCDFAGYSLMALGVARALGVTLVQNFNAPILATSPTDFWHRWNISLSQWFRDYVYIPLGGSKRGIPRWVFAISITFLLSGLWHGANWTFVLWGAVHGAALIASVLLARAIPSHFTVVGGTLIAWIATQVFVTVSWVFFRAGSVSQSMDIISTISRAFLVTGRGWTDLFALPEQFGIPPFILIVGLLVLAWITLLDRATFESHGDHPFNCRSRWAGRLQQCVMIACIAFALTFGPAMSRPFIYFQF